MHIPDGYLSPATCVVLYGGAAPFWYVSLRKIRRQLHTRVIPLISVFSAFSFVIMMFNLPLPGGTTGHAVGMGVTTVVLGPWGSILAISVALTIQAFFFGDGGITALGANCFNMAIVGSLVTYLVYRWIAGRSPLTSRRRMFSAAIAGYVAINTAALFAAVEFGVQPLLFKDAMGAPLYAPYPLSVAIPAMMIGHLTFAGAAEAIITGGIVAYLQRSDASLLAPFSGLTVEGAATESRTSILGRLWAGLAALMLLTPLGVLAVGTAWGEWSVKDFADAAAREKIIAASQHRTLPAGVPEGLHRLSSAWTAPFPDYAPQFIRSEPVGYMLSAMFGVGIILAVLWLGRKFLLRGGNTP